MYDPPNKLDQPNSTVTHPGISIYSDILRNMKASRIDCWYIHCLYVSVSMLSQVFLKYHHEERLVWLLEQDLCRIIISQSVARRWLSCRLVRSLRETAKLNRQITRVQAGNFHLIFVLKAILSYNSVALSVWLAQLFNISHSDAWSLTLAGSPGFNSPGQIRSTLGLISPWLVK